jgi:hypothetical protein
MSAMHHAALVADLVSIVGPDHVLTDPGLRAGYEADWSGRYRGEATAVVRPAGPEQVAEIVRACRAAGVPIVPQGGNTGLVGGGIPRDGAILLSLRHLTAIEPVDGMAERGRGRRRDRRLGPPGGGGGRVVLRVDLAARDWRPSAGRSPRTPAGSTCSATDDPRPGARRRGRPGDGRW